MAVDRVCPACHPLRVVLELSSEADTEVLWSVTRPTAALPACARVSRRLGCERAGGHRSAWGVLLSLRPGAGPPSPLLLGCVPGPRGEAMARLHFSTSPGWINVSAAGFPLGFHPVVKHGDLVIFNFQFAGLS